MKAFVHNPRTGLPALALVVTLVLAFAVPPFNSVVAAGSSSSMSSNSQPSPPIDCHSDFNGGTVHPGDTVNGDLALRAPCHYVRRGGVDVALNGTHLPKDADSNGAVAVSVKVNSLTSGDLGDPVPVQLHQGTNTVVVTGEAQDQNDN